MLVYPSLRLLPPKLSAEYTARAAVYLQTAVGHCKLGCAVFKAAAGVVVVLLDVGHRGFACVFRRIGLFGVIGSCGDILFNFGAAGR